MQPSLPEMKLSSVQYSVSDSEGHTLILSISPMRAHIETEGSVGIPASPHQSSEVQIN